MFIFVSLLQNVSTYSSNRQATSCTAQGVAQENAGYSRGYCQRTCKALQSIDSRFAESTYEGGQVVAFRASNLARKRSTA